MTVPWEIITTLIVSVFASTGFWTFLVAIYNRRATKQSAETKLLIGLAHNVIFDKCEKYIKRGYIEPSEYDDLLYIYKPYLDSGGNGTAKHLMELVEKLPFKNE